MILLMGLPGSGKGTQGKMMADQHGMHLVSMGELIRLYVTGVRRQRMLAGELMEDDEVIAILGQVLATIPDKQQCVLDGFPRTIFQAEWLLNKAHQEGFSLSHVINLEASIETVKNRLSARGRKDDKDSVIVERFKEYDHSTKPLILWYKEHNIDVVTINAERSVDEVNDDVIATLKLR